MLRDFPSWLLYMKTYEFIGIIAYTLTFALFETLLVCGVVLAVGAVVPRRWVSNSFVPISLALLIELSIMAAVFQHFIIQEFPKKLLLASYLLLLALTAFIVVKSQKLMDIMRRVVDRLTILTFLYVFFDVVGLIIVIARNV
jgi:hypothetical protein